MKVSEKQPRSLVWEHKETERRNMDLKGQATSENGVGATSSQEPQLHDERRPVAFELAPLQTVENAVQRQAEGTRGEEPSAAMGEATGFEEKAVLDYEGATPLLIAVLHENYDAARMLRRTYIDELLEMLLGPNPPPLSFYEYHKHELEINHTNFFVRNMIENRFGSVRIGKVLAKIHCDLDEVVQFRNPVMTKAYLLSCTNENADFNTLISTDLYDFDLRHIHVLINCRPKSKARKTDFIFLLMHNVCDYQKSKAGRDFLKKLCCWETVDEDFLEILEKYLRLFPKRCIKVILKYGFHSMAKVKYGRDITVNIFANSRRKVVSLLNNEEIDVDKRYCEGNTPLHFAAKYYAAKNIQLLIEKGAHPNAFNDEGDTPLSLALKNEGDGIYSSEKSIKLLLFGGANPMTVSEQFEGTFFRFDRSTSTTDYGMNVIKLLVAQLAIYEAIGRSIEQPIKMLLTFCNQELETFLEGCRRQLDAFKTHEICDRENHTCRLKFTIFTILSERPEILARYISEEHLQTISQLMTAYYRKTSNSYYLELFRQRVKEITRIRFYRNRAIQTICNFISIHDSNHLVVCKIISYFTVKDLVIFNTKLKEKSY